MRFAPALSSKNACDAGPHCPYIRPPASRALWDAVAFADASHVPRALPGTP
jgi:hypothetical protein